MRIEFVNPEHTIIARWLSDSEVEILEPGHPDFDEASLTASAYVPPSEEAILAEQAALARDRRNSLLVSCDWTQLPDAPVDQTAWAVYRQALRDITDQPGFPANVNWPEPPA